jgi:hypothetical protein
MIKPESYICLWEGKTANIEKFTVANESIYPDFRKEQVLKARDGGSSTLK